MKKIAICFGMLFFAVACFGEVKVYDYEGVEEMLDIWPCEDGLLIPCQWDRHPGHGLSPFALRVNSNGDTLWSYSSDPSMEHDCLQCGA